MLGYEARARRIRRMQAKEQRRRRRLAARRVRGDLDLPVGVGSRAR